RLVMPPGLRKLEVRSRTKKPVKKLAAGSQSKDQDQISSAHTGIQTQKPTSNFNLTIEQQNALSIIIKAIDQNKPEKFLLYGVTGSGKTEVYMQAIAYILNKGKAAIVMVPEISLTPQLVQRFRDRFQDHIAVLHSELTEKQRVGEWERIATREGRIVLGTRSAVFAPVKDLGLIVIDEEYETTYKSEKSPRYHAREVALKLAELNNATVIIGSATPSVETYYRAEKGEYTKLSLPKRIDDRPLPPVEVIDMRGEGFGVLSERLKDEIKGALSGGEQIILFMNRLGYFTFIMCRECGLTLECPQCSVSLVYHSADRRLRCGRCGYSTDAPIICPRCHSSSIKYFGTGTQRIEEEVASIFPAARLLRYDRDTVGQRGSHEAFFSTFAAGKADVLIGTQMVTKGLDIANVTLVGAVAADTALYLPDFRAAEHTFQLLTQVAGRAGRHHLPGKVIIQTYNPEHYAIRAAAQHDYEEFYKQEIEFRKELNYPPFSRLISLLISGADEKKVAKVSEDLGKFLNKRLKTAVLGPAAAAIPRLRGQWRYRILLKGDDLGQLRRAIAETLEKAVVPVDVKIAIDVEPMSLL
ncbi:MAG: primosomal protein N', partial [Candidatus Margulisbacteria bacterium]|nr:primosomal protein N' [Candidatus Margulisiibacteriota bacterium]